MPTVTLLNEIEIHPDSYIKKLVFEAFQRVPINYPISNYDCFYRNYMAQNNQWKRFVEANLLITDLRLLIKNEKETFKIFLNEIRVNKNLPEFYSSISDTYLFLSHPFLFNPAWCNYELKNTVIYDDMKIYIIKFYPKWRRAIYEGTLFIDSATKGFVKVEMHFPNDEKYFPNHKGWTKYNGKFTKYLLKDDLCKQTVYFKKLHDKFYFDKIILSLHQRLFIQDKDTPLHQSKYFKEAYFNKIEQGISTKKLLLKKGENLLQLRELLNNSTFWNSYNFPVQDSLQKSVIKILQNDSSRN